jgi:hypothetical protein
MERMSGAEEVRGSERSDIRGSEMHAMTEISGVILGEEERLGRRVLELVDRE